jgi:uncharacterized protein (TIGR02118 family)
MLKILSYLKRKEGTSLEEFRRWWIQEHAPMVVQRYGKSLVRYVVNIRLTDDDNLPGAPNDASEFDGCAELWFESEASYRDAYCKTDRPSAARLDTLAHVSRFQRIIVNETVVVAGPS